MIDEIPVITPEILKLCIWASNYYQYPLGQVIFGAMPSSVKSGKKMIINNNVINENIPKKNITLNDEQDKVYKAILKLQKTFSPNLVEGVTGSGKTELYIKISEDIISQNGQVLIIVPEINLTPQTLNRFQNYLAGNIMSYHSALSEKIKNDTWGNCKTGDIDIIIGTRSSVFIPFRNLKMIIIDEEHDVSLKQSEKFRYHARDVALVRGKYLNIPVLLGSATPSFETLHNCKKGKYNHFFLKNRYFKNKLPVVKVIDINKDSPYEGFSSGLIRSIKSNLANKKQVLLFVNRRGFSHTLLCKKCGWTSKCFNCDAHMTYHKYDNKLYCHHCGQQKKIDPKNVCNCKNKSECEVIPLGIGTERIESQAKILFPKSTILRIDSDTINSTAKLKNFLENAHSGKADILIGTQMLVKGHDFPNLTLVGVMDIDSGLYSLDFRSIEKVAQMIIQVAGRSGRHNVPGEVIIQTRKPNHPLITELLTKGYNSFSVTALKDRNQASLPPYSYLTLFRASSLNKKDAMEFLSYIKQGFNDKSIKILGPAPAPILKKNNRYFYQLLINSNNRKFLLQKSSEIREYIIKQKKSNIRWSIDIDPIDLY